MKYTKPEVAKYFLDRKEKYKVKNLSSKANFPKNSLIELTNACNHACIFCANPRMNRNIKNLDKKIFVKFIKEASDLGLEEVGLYSTGEPFLTKNIDFYISEAKKNNIRRVYVTTNGSLATLDKVIKAYNSGLNSIKYSINAATEKNHQIIHGSKDFKKILNNLEQVYNWKIKNKINLEMLGSFVYTKLTISEIEIYKKKFSKYFTDINILPAAGQGGRYNSEIQKISTSYEIHHERNINEIEPCDMLWNRIHLTSEGYLTACCVDYENDLVYADFNSGKSLKDLWNNNLIIKLREKHINKKLDNTICKNCLLGCDEKYEKISDLKYEYNKNRRDLNLDERYSKSL